MTDEATEDEPFTWENCYADVHTYAHGRTIVGYVQDVVKPAFAALEAKMAELDESDEGWAPFAKSDLEDLRQETFLAFALALQSIWERQLRNYLVGCAGELKLPDLAPDVVKGAKSWEQLCTYFHKLRGIPLNAFPSFEALDLLQLLGNACRHGEGASAVKLWKRKPDLWPPSLPSPFEDEPADNGPQHPEGIRLTIPDLEQLASAVAAFWDDAEYIYNESISQKHRSLERQLVTDRATRAWRPKASNYP